MKLLLTSAGITNKSIAKALLRLVRKPAKKIKLAFIPTASNPGAGDRDWFIDDLVKIQKQRYGYVDIVDISALPKSDWLPRIKAANVLFFNGGDEFHLMQWLKKSGLAKLMPELLRTRVYVGVSAGSMVASGPLSFSQSHELYPDTIGRHKDARGLGLVNFQIRPHLNSPYFPKARVDYIGKVTKKIPETLIALDDQSAVQIIGGKIKFISEGTYKIFNPIR